MLSSVETVLTSAKYTTNRPRMVALTVFLYAMGSLTFAPFFYLLNFYPQAKALMSLYFLLSLYFIFKPSRITS